MLSANKIIELVLTSELDEGLIKPFIGVTELKYFKKALGTSFFNQLKSEVDSSDFTGLNQELWDEYLSYAFAWYCAYESFANLKAEPTNLGFKEFNTEFASPAPESSYGVLSSKYKANGDTYLEGAIDFINDNSSQFPLYGCAENVQTNNFPIDYYGKGE